MCWEATSEGMVLGAQIGRDGSFSPFLVTETTGEGAESSCTPGKSQMQLPAAPGLGLLLPPLLVRGCVRGDGWWQEGLDTSESQAVPGLCLTPGAAPPRRARGQEVSKVSSSLACFMRVLYPLVHPGQGITALSSTPQLLHPGVWGQLYFGVLQPPLVTCP